MPTAYLTAGPIDYTDTGGDGPTVVLLHGLLMNETLWRKVIPRLPGFRCIAPALPLGGHRRPMDPGADLSQLGVARIVADFLDALGLRDVTLVLNDWGGAQFMISDDRMDRVGRLVLASCEAFDNFPPRPARGLVTLCRLPGGTALLARMTRSRVFRHSPRMFGGLSKHGVPDSILDDWFAPAASTAGIRRDLRKFATGTPDRTTLLEWNSKLPGFTKPVLVCWASEDRMMPLSHARRLAVLFPRAVLVEISDSWTLLPEDQPGRFADALRGFAGPEAAVVPGEVAV